MYVTEYSIGLESMNLESARGQLIQHRDGPIALDAISQLRIVAGLCNSGDFDAASQHLPLSERKINGDATDQAILRFSESLGSISEIQQMWKKTFELAFNSKNKYMIRTLKLVQQEGLKLALPSAEAASFRPDDTYVVELSQLRMFLANESRLLTIKGAPDVLIGRCSKYTTVNGESKVLDDLTRAQIESIKDKWSSQGKRVILLARKTIVNGQNQIEGDSGRVEDDILHLARDGLTLVGIVGIVDPPREEIPSVVSTLRGAGIRIFMVIHSQACLISVLWA